MSNELFISAGYGYVVKPLDDNMDSLDFLNYLFELLDDDSQFAALGSGAPNTDEDDDTVLIVKDTMVEIGEDSDSFKVRSFNSSPVFSSDMFDEVLKLKEHVHFDYAFPKLLIVPLYS